MDRELWRLRGASGREVRWRGERMTDHPATPILRTCIQGKPLVKSTDETSLGTAKRAGTASNKGRGRTHLRKEL